MANEAARVTVDGVLDAQTTPVVGAPIVGPGAPTVKVNGSTISVLGDSVPIHGSHSSPPLLLIVPTTATVFAEGKLVIRAGDLTGYGSAVQGLPNPPGLVSDVIIGN